MAINDITKTGAQTYRELQFENNADFAQRVKERQAEILSGYNSFAQSREFEPEEHQEQHIQSPLYGTGTSWGQSRWDNRTANENEFNSLQDIRANNQSWSSKFGAGLAKMVGLAGTTFLDGTVGLIWGSAEGLAGWAKGESGVDNWSKLFDNEISNGLHEFNQAMEEWLPNYRSEEEQNNKWYQNLGTVNFWADGFLKNLGFTIGALYSGGLWTKALRGIGLMKEGSTLGAKLVGSIFSAVNEGRVEANNNTSDKKELELQQAEDAAARRRQEILNDASLSEEERIVALDELERNYKTTLAQIDESLKKAGLLDLGINIPILALDNFWTFGRMYAQGFQNSVNVTAEQEARGAIKSLWAKAKNKIRNTAKTANELNSIAENGIARNVKREGAGYIWDTITKKEAIGRGLLTSLREGNEEMAQAFAAEFAGNWNFYKDSPDTYYRAMTDPQALKETSDAWTALSTGFLNTYGNGDRYEEFAIGALTGLLGTPTFGRSQNASANSWAGHGFVSISGGILGEYRSAMEENRIGEAHVKQMNKLAERIQHNKGLLAASKKYTDAMHAWAEEKDAFEYKNQEDNEDWRGITSFLSTGRKADLMELIDQDFENASDEELAAIAAFTTPNGSEVGAGGWRDASGHLITADSAQEDKDNMRKKLAEKRDKIKSNIASYERSLSLVRNLVNGSKEVSEDEVNELAWLHWKTGRFTERYNEILDDPDNKAAYRALDAGLQTYEDALRDQVEESLIDTSGLTGTARARAEAENLVLKQRAKENEKSLHNIQALRSFLQDVVTAKGDRRQLIAARNLKANLEVLNTLMSDDVLYDNFLRGTGMSREELNKSLRQLQDLGRLSEAFVQFDKRFSEFAQDPNKLRANRKKIDQQNAEVQEAVEESSRRKKSRDLSAEQVKALDDEELDDALSSLDENNPNDAAKITLLKQEVEKRKTGNAIRNRLRDMEEEAESTEDSAATAAIQTALTMLEQAMAEADSAEEVTDIENEIYQGLTQLEAQSLEEEALQDAAFAVLSQAIDGGVKAMEESERRQAETKSVGQDETTGEVTTPGERATSQSKETGHDSVDSTPPVNAPQTAQKKPKRKQTKAEQAAERSRKKREKRLAREERKKEKAAGERSEKQKAKNNELVVNATIYALQLLADDITITDEIFIAATDLVSQLVTALENAETEQDVADATRGVANQQEWKNFQDAVGVELSDEYLLALAGYVFYSGQDENMSEESDSTEAREKRVGIATQTPDIDIQSEDYETLDWTPINLGSWMSLIREYPIHGRDITPYHLTETFKKQLKAKLIVKGLKGKELEDAVKAEVKRITAVYDYLKAHNAFSNAAKVRAAKRGQPGTKIHFVVDPTLNNNAGEVVILMATDPEGKNIIGAVRGANEIVSEQSHLQSFIQRTVEAFEKSDSDSIWASKETTHVAQTLQGRIMFSNESYSLNEIYSTGTDEKAGVGEFLLGIYMPDGNVVLSSRAKTGSRTAQEKRVKPPYKKGVAGQPFLMVPTGEGIGQYVPVPIHMNLYGPQMATSKFAQFVQEHLTEVFDEKTLNNKKTQLAIKLALEDLFAHQFHVNVQGGKFKIAATMQDGVQRNIFEGNLKDATLPAILDALQNAGLGIQINRKYINGKISIGGTSVNYNEVIGELAATNILPGFGHTVNDFFTLNPINNKGEEETAVRLESKESPINDDAKGTSGTKTQVTVNNIVYYLKEDGRITDAAGKFIAVDSETLVKIKAVAEIKNNELVSVDTANPTVYQTSYGFYDTKTSKFVGEEDMEEARQKAAARQAEEESQPKKKGRNGDKKVLSLGTTTSQITIPPYIDATEKQLKDKTRDWETYVNDTTRVRDNQKFSVGPYAQFTLVPAIGLMIDAGMLPGVESDYIQGNSVSIDAFEKVLEVLRKYNIESPAQLVEYIKLHGVTEATEDKSEGIEDQSPSGPAENTSETAVVTRISTDEDAISQDEAEATMRDTSEGRKVQSFKFSGTRTETPAAETSKTEPAIPKCFNTAALKAMFNSLTVEQQAAVSALSAPMQRQVMLKLKLAFTNGQFTGDVDKLITPSKYRLAEPNYKKANLAKEAAWLQRVLPQLSEEQRVTIVKGLIKIANSPTPQKAWGKFQNGIITLSDEAARGTTYHEAFHFVTQTLLTEDELSTLYTEGAQKYKLTDIDDIEESLAEEYRKYVQLEETPLIGSIVKVFRKLKHIVQGFLGNELFTSNLFYRISAGEMARYGSSIANRATYRTPLKEEYKGKLIFAASGTGKSSIADDINVIDSDKIFADLLGTSKAAARLAFLALNADNREQLLAKYKQRIKELVAEGKTVLTANPAMLDTADVIVYNETAEQANSRTTSSDRVGSNRLSNLEYHKEVIEKAKTASDTRGVQSVALKEDQYLADVLLTDSSFKIPAASQRETMLLDNVSKFLGQFGINVNILTDYNGDQPLFDALNRVVNIRTSKDITNGLGEAISFMMQYDPNMRKMISVLKTGSEKALVSYNFHKPFRLEISNYLYRFHTDKQKYIKYLGEEIADRLRDFYGMNTVDPKDATIWKVIAGFFDKLNPIARYRVKAINSMLDPIVKGVLRGDNSFIVRDYVKPGTAVEGQIVDVAQALQDNPYEDSIVRTMNKYGISLAGGASIAASGTLYRPSENPLHDLDLNAVGKTKEEIEEILQKEYGNFKQTNTIVEKGSKDKTTLTYLVMDRPFIERRPLAGIGVSEIVDAKTGEKLGTRVASELVLEDGVHGKMLDFFIGKDNRPFGNTTIKLNGREYLVSDYRNAMEFKIQVAREKDIWDYARFVPYNKAENSVQEDLILPDNSINLEYLDQLKRATDNVGSFSTTNNDIRYRRVENAADSKQNMINSAQDSINSEILDSYNNGNMSRQEAVLAWSRMEKDYLRRGIIVQVKNPTMRGTLDLTVTDVIASPELRDSNRIKERRTQKVAYKNLTITQKSKLRELGVSEAAYETMTEFEKEEFWRCKR